MLYKSIKLSEDAIANLDVLSMPIYKPRSRDWQRNDRPAVIIVPGGSYLYCSDREKLPVAFKFLAEGYQVFVLEYHVGDESDYPTPFIDLANAVKHIKDNSETYAINKGDITVVGFSAGGHLVGTYGALTKNERFQRDMGMTYEDLKIHQMVLGYPAVNLKPIADAIQHYKAFDIVGKLFTTYDEIKDGKAQAHKDMPKTFVFHSLDDPTVPAIHVVDYVEHLVKVGVNVEFHMFNEGGHGYSTGDGLSILDDGTFPTRVKEWLGLCFNWLESVRRKDD